MLKAERLHRVTSTEEIRELLLLFIELHQNCPCAEGATARINELVAKWISIYGHDKLSIRDFLIFAHDLLGVD